MDGGQLDRHRASGVGLDVSHDRLGNQGASRRDDGNELDHVVLAEFSADAARHLIDIHEKRVVAFCQIRGEVHVEALDEVHDVAQVVAGLGPAERNLLRYEKAEHERQQFVLGAQHQRVVQESGDVVEGFTKEFLVARQIDGRPVAGAIVQGEQSGAHARLSGITGVGR